MSKKEYTKEYQEFWKLWPGRWRPEEQRVIKVGKWDGFLEWKKLDTEDQEEILQLLRSGRVKRAGTTILPDAPRWLKKKRWDDFS